MYLYKAIIFDWENCLAQSRQHPVRLADGAQELIDQLHADEVKLAILTNGQPSLLTRYDGFANVKPLFSAIVTANDVERYKPHPEGIEKIMQLLNVSPEETLMIGDAESDIIAARTAGVDAALYLGDENAAYYQDQAITELNPTYTLRTFSELIDLIKI